MWQKIKTRFHFIWCHRTKTLGGIVALAGYVQNNIAQAGNVIPPRWQGAILSAAGILVFLIGLYNSAPRDPPG